MAEGIIFPLVTNVLTKLGSAVVQEIGSIYMVHEELEKLQRTFSAIKAVLLDAEQKKDHSHGVKDWLEKLTDAAYDVDDLLDCFSYESTRRKVITEGKKAKMVRIFFSKHNQIVFRCKMTHKIKNLRERLDLIADERKNYQFKETINYQYENGGRDTHSFVREEEVIGRDTEKAEVVKHLLEINEKQNVSVDAIVGLGGMGKTMLAQSVFNHKRVKDAFDLRMWVCVSEIFDRRIIVEKIIESVTNQRPSSHEMDPLQRQLRSQIDEKKYLLVMDDLWNEDGERWAGLKTLLMGGAKGSKILITTRTSKVAEVSQATSTYNLNRMSESDSWILFQQVAFKECEEPKSPNMIQIGKEIAKKCIGVPLVIRTIGRLLYFKTSEAEWLSFKNNDLSTITQEENVITQTLKLSYNHLPSHLKPCFAYCSLFSEDHAFDKDELIKLWVAEGFVLSQGEDKCLEDVGNEYFMELIWRSIFQDVQRNEYGDVVGCKMHDLMHDLARLVAGTECFTPYSDIKDVNERTRRVLYDPRGKVKWSVLSTSQLKPYKLRTFASSGSLRELNETRLIAHDISSLKLLRVLNLQNSMIKVPYSLGMLKHLRFLNLSGNGEIQSMPSSITKLHNLQTLNLRCCNVWEELPGDIGSLTNLRHFDISDNSRIRHLPDSITRLKFLQTLTLNHSVISELPGDIGSLTNLRHFDISGNSDIQLLPDSITRLKFLQTLNLNDSTILKLPENMGDMVELRFLHLHYCHRIRLLPNSITKLQKLQVLNLECCDSLRKLPSDVSNLVNLKYLDLEGCDKMRGMPCGLDKLTGLQTMNLYVVGASVSSEDGGLWQLNTLVNIRGSLRIQGLHHLRKDASQANTVNLKYNHVRKLTLEWREYGYNPNGIDPDFMVLEKLHPNKNVETVIISGYGGVILSSWVSSLSNLMEIKIFNCENLQYIPRLDRLPNLQKLLLLGLNLIEYMDNNETVDEFGSSVFFPSLQSLDLGNMEKLKEWWKPREFSPKDPGPSFLPPSFHCLSGLSISGCPQLISIPSPNSSLTELRLSYSNLELFKGEVIGSASPEDGMQQEALDGHVDLHSEGAPKPATLPEGFQHLTALKSLSIEDCDDLVVLPDWIGDLTSLQELKINDCPKLTSLPDTIGQLSSLWELTIFGCSRRLQERCKRQIGEDWWKIAHVKHISILSEDVVMSSSISQNSS